MDAIWWDRPFTVTGVEIGAGHATLHVLTSYQRRAGPSSCAPTTPAWSTGSMCRCEPPAIKTWADIDAETHQVGRALLVSGVEGQPRRPAGKCDLVAGTNTDLSLPLASIFKLYVLLAVADAVKAGTVGWNDQLTVTKRGQGGRAAGLEELPPGATVSVRTAAQQMISASDNMATDLLIARLGPGAVERALAAAGHHDPAQHDPVPDHARAVLGRLG